MSKDQHPTNEGKLRRPWIGYWLYSIIMGMVLAFLNLHKDPISDSWLWVLVEFIVYSLTCLAVIRGLMYLACAVAARYQRSKTHPSGGGTGV